jgi:hypothetical protein
MRRLLLGLVSSVVILALATSGCLGPTPPDEGDEEDAPVELLARDTPLWRNPQDHPHPAFNYPTLTNPPEGMNIPKWWQPVPAAEVPGTISGLEHVAGAGTEVPSGAGLAIFGSIVVMPGFTAPARTIDISDPTRPVVLAEFDINGRGAVMIPYPDGRLVTVISSSSNLHVYDITDPTQIEPLGTLDPATGSHKVGVVPGTPIVYNANSHGGGIVEGYTDETATGVTEIYDLTDPEDPILVQVFENGYGCHHVYFWINAQEDRYRAICAGIEVTQLWDIKDPRNPEVIVNIPVHHGNPLLPHGAVFIAAFSHFSILNTAGNILIVGDETGGGAAPGCDVNAPTPLGDLSGPIGNVWFYDISDETDPQLRGWISPTNPIVSDPGNPITCTAHHGRIVPDAEGRDLLAMAFYGAGVALIDFTDPEHPFIVDRYADGTDTWEVWYYNGWLVTGDLARGMDILRLR